MFKYVIKRLVGGFFTVFFIATVTFFMMHATPGDPLMKAKAVNPVIQANLRAKYGLDQPLMIQYVRYIGNMAKGDFGISFTQENRQVNDIIREAFPVSALLGTISLIWATIGGIMWGAFTAHFRNKYPDRVIMFLVILGTAVPAFVFAAVGQFLVTVLNGFTDSHYNFKLLPVAGWGEVQHMILPSLFLGLGTMAYLTRLKRSSLLEIINSDYVRTARAKGLSQKRIFFQHQFRNAILPVLTVLGPAFAGITTGAFSIESIFAIPGLGRFFVQAIQQLDYTAIMGLTTFFGGYIVLITILVDIAYGFIDPRIKISKGH